MRDNSDLIGKRYRNGDGSLTIYEVKSVDLEHPALIHAESVNGHERVCAIADFARFNLVAINEQNAAG
jgi:hypothetical protein